MEQPGAVSSRHSKNWDQPYSSAGMVTRGKVPPLSLLAGRGLESGGHLLACAAGFAAKVGGMTGNDGFLEMDRVAEHYDALGDKEVCLLDALR